MPSGIYKHKKYAKIVQVECKTCRKVFRKHFSVVKRSKNKFCSQHCHYLDNVGKPRPMEVRQKISKNSARVWLGKKLSEETKRKISESNKKNPRKFWLGKKIPEETKRKIALSLKGISAGDKNPAKRPEVRLKMSEKSRGIPRFNQRGEKSAHWKGGITPINEKIRRSLEYKFWRTAVFTRDNWTCVECRAKGYVQADHIKPFAYYPELRFELSNGRTLCIDCHRKTDTWGGNVRKFAKTLSN